MQQRAQQWRVATVCLCLAGLASTAQAQSTSTTKSESKQFEVVAVDGNHLVVKTAAGAKDYTVNDDVKFTVDGKAVTVKDLKPGMKGTATLTTKTTVIPVVVTEVKSGEVVQKSGNSIIVRSGDGIKMFSEGDMSKRNIEIVKDGQPVNIADLRVGDKLSATIVTTHPPKVVTERQLKASLASNTMPGAAPASKAAMKSGTTSTTPSNASASSGTAPEAHAKKLPKTASTVPLTGLIGVLCLALGLGLTIARSRRGTV